jgi:hypothetical protein
MPRLKRLDFILQAIRIHCKFLVRETKGNLHHEGPNKVNAHPVTYEEHVSVVEASSKGT